MIGQRAITIGSSRQAGQIIRKLGLEHLGHVNEAGSRGEPGTSAGIALEIARILNFQGLYGTDDLFFLALGRGTVPGGIQASADSRSAVAAILAGREISARWTGPTPSIARTFEDKLLSYQFLSSSGVATVPFSSIPDNSLEWPVVVKATRLTGGAGMLLADDQRHAMAHIAKLRLDGQESVVTSLVSGIEVSIEGVISAGTATPLALVFKEPCDRSLRHADWKVKLATSSSAFPPALKLFNDIVDLCPDETGFISIEAIIAEPDHHLAVLEVATRRTGNAALSEGVAGTGLLRRAFGFGEAGALAETLGGADRIGLGIPLVGDVDVCSTLGSGSQLIETRLDDLTALSSSASTKDASSMLRTRASYLIDSKGSPIEVRIRGINGTDMAMRVENLVRRLIALGVESPTLESIRVTR